MTTAETTKIIRAANTAVRIERALLAGDYVADADDIMEVTTALLALARATGVITGAPGMNGGW